MGLSVGRVRHRAKARLRAAVAVNRDRRGTRLVARLAQGYLNAFHNFEYNASRNGEARVLRCASGAGLRVVLDVGANIGQWSRLAVECSPDAEIHAFEIVPETARRLAATPGVHRVNAFGLGGRAESVEVRVPFGPTSVHASIYGTTGATVTGRLETGDAYCADHGIAAVDFVKIDTEGSELDVLAGLSDLLGSRSIQMIQFECGALTFGANHCLKDFYDLLEPAGFTIGKIYPESVDFRPYEPGLEQWAGPNHLAVLRDSPVLGALRGTPGAGRSSPARP